MSDYYDATPPRTLLTHSALFAFPRTSSEGPKANTSRYLMIHLKVHLMPKTFILFLKSSKYLRNFGENKSDFG